MLKPQAPLALDEPATPAKRLGWYEERLKSDISLEHAIKWLDSLNLHHTNYTIALADQLHQQRDIAGALELLRTFICANLKQQNYDAAIMGLDTFHSTCLKSGQSPRDLFVDDYLNLYLPREKQARVPSGAADKIKIGYMVPLALDQNSTIPPVAAELACQHSDQFEAYVLVPFTREQIEKANPRLNTIMEDLLESTRIVYNDAEYQTEWQRVRAFTGKLEALELEALIAMLSIFSDSAIAFMRPAHQVLAVDLGNPHWYAHKYIDTVFSTHPHFHLEAQTESLYAPLGFTRKQSLGKTNTASEQKVPEIKFKDERSLTLFSSGSTDKFQNEWIWKIYNSVLEDADVNWVFLGPEPAFIMNNISPRFHNRVNAFPRSPNFTWFLSQADLYVDTFPIGGGYSLLEAFETGIPCALFHHDTNKPFNKGTNFAPYSHISDDRSFACEPSDDEFKRQILTLVQSSEARKKQAALQHENCGQVLSSKGLIQRMEETIRQNMGQTDD